MPLIGNHVHVSSPPTLGAGGPVHMVWVAENVLISILTKLYPPSSRLWGHGNLGHQFRLT